VNVPDVRNAGGVGGAAIAAGARSNGSDNNTMRISQPRAAIAVLAGANFQSSSETERLTYKILHAESKTLGRLSAEFTRDWSCQLSALAVASRGRNGPRLCENAEAVHAFRVGAGGLQ
jgi:hypothetical protein